jgi:nucleoside-diphosphate kinase
MNKTLAIIKPDAIKNGFTGKIIDRILCEKFTILGMKQIHASRVQAEEFYNVHKGKPFYDELCDFMSSTPIVVLALKRENAVKYWRDVIGNTDPADAAEGTIRKLYAESKGHNAVHGSDSDENAKTEILHWFSQCELIISD